MGSWIRAQDVGHRKMGHNIEEQDTPFEDRLKEIEGILRVCIDVRGSTFVEYGTFITRR